MGLLNVGKRVGQAGLGVGAIGLGVAYMAHRRNEKARENWDPNSPNKPGITSSIKEGLLDFGLGDKYADIHLMGFPMRLSHLLPVPDPFQMLPEPLLDLETAWDATKFVYQNEGLEGISSRVQNQDKLQSWYKRKAGNSIKNYTTTIDYGLSNSADLPYDDRAQSSQIRHVPMSRYPARTSSALQEGVRADGSMVFGMYNLRLR